MGPKLAFDAGANLITSGLQSMVVHCHFYNCALQAAIESAMGERAPELLADSARRVVRAQLDALNVSPREAYAAAGEIFRALGFGTLDFTNVEAGEVVLRSSHYAMGWVASHGTRERPVCYFPAGFVAASAEVATGAPVEVTETRCYVSGAEDCAFSLRAK